MTTGAPRAKVAGLVNVMFDKGIQFSLSLSFFLSFFPFFTFFPSFFLSFLSFLSLLLSFFFLSLTQMHTYTLSIPEGLAYDDVQAVVQEMKKVDQSLSNQPQPQLLLVRYTFLHVLSTHFCGNLCFTLNSSTPPP